MTFEVYPIAKEFMEDNTATAQLRQLLTTYFTLAELHELCFAMGFDFENLPHIYGEKPKNVIALIKILHGQNRLPEFVALCRQERPHLDWPTAPTKLYFAEEIQAQAKRKEALDEYKKYIRGRWGRDSLLDGPLDDFFYIRLEGQRPEEKKLKEASSPPETSKDSLPESSSDDSEAGKQNQDKKEPQYVSYLPPPLVLQEAGVQESFHQTFWPYAAACKLYDDWQTNAENTWQFLSSATRNLPYASRLHHPAWQEPILMLAALLGEKKQLNFLFMRQPSLPSIYFCHSGHLEALFL